MTSDPAARYLRAEDRLTEETNWQTLAFLMEGFIFLLMGSASRTFSYAGQTTGSALSRPFSTG